MGHHQHTVRACGKNRDEAENEAHHEFYRKHGDGHSIYEVLSARFVAKVPPIETVVTREGNYEVIKSEPNTAAPPERWLEEWEFVLHTHF